MLAAMENRSVPVDLVLPHVFYDDVAAAIGWLGRVFGLEEHYRYGEPAAGAQLRLGKAVVMLSEAQRPGRSTPARSGLQTQMLTIFVDDVDAHFAKAKAGGAEIVEELNEPIYGERQYVARDPEGHSWLFSQHVRDVDPREWGAQVAKE